MYRRQRLASTAENRCWHSREVRARGDLEYSSSVALVTRHGAVLYYDVRGSGEAIVFLHNLGGDAAVWSAQIAHFASSHRTLAIELRGHGASAPADDPLTFDDLVADVIAVMDDAGVERATLVGVSLGGMLALRVALRVPERIRGVVVCATDPRQPSLGSRFKLWLLRAALLLLGKRALGSAAQSLVGATTLRERAAVVTALGVSIARAHVGSVRRFARMLAGRDDIGEALSRLRMPITAIVGLEDRALPVERARGLRGLLPAATWCEIPDAGHLAAVETPALVTEAIERQLAPAQGPR